MRKQLRLSAITRFIKEKTLYYGSVIGIAFYTNGDICYLVRPFKYVSLSFNLSYKNIQSWFEGKGFEEIRFISNIYDWYGSDVCWVMEKEIVKI